jgi:hypothetical protein
MSAEDFDALYQRLQRTVAWGPADRRGALNHIRPAHILTAASEIRLGRTAPLGAAIETEVTLDNPDPCVHQMTSPAGDEADRSGLSFAMDRVAMNIHGNVDSHIDALCHVIYRALLYNNVPADSITASGASELSINVARSGIVGRGVLLDVPRLSGRSWLEPGEHVSADDLRRAEAAQHLAVGEGDLLCARRPSPSPGRTRPVGCSGCREIPPLRWSSWSNDGWQCRAAATTTLRRAWLTVSTPVHVLAVNALGLLPTTFNFTISCGATSGPLVFSLCDRALRLSRATGSPVNPIAIM